MREVHADRLDLPTITVQDPSGGQVDDANAKSSAASTDTDSSNGCRCLIQEESHFDQLKLTTARLNLTTRRPSYTAWREQYMGSPFLSARRPFTIHETTLDDGLFTEERKTKIDEQIEWLRCELLEMRSQDKLLACRLLSLRKDIHLYKLQKGLQEHEELLDDAKADYEEFGQISELCDMPLEDFGVNRQPLKNLGVTRLNLTARRFSTC